MNKAARCHCYMKAYKAHWAEKINPLYFDEWVEYKGGEIKARVEYDPRGAPGFKDHSSKKPKKQ